jgi:type II secretory pathway pseudopilin PulG
MNRKKSAFTILSLLAVIAIQAMMAPVLIVSISRARRLAQQAVCRTNLSGLGKAIATYQCTYSGYPFIRNAQSMDPTAEPKKAMSAVEFKKLLKNTNTDKNIHIIDNLMLLKYTRCLDSRKIFRCPSNPNAKKLMARKEATEYGFSKGDNFYIDYAYHNGYRYNGTKYNRAAFRDGMASMPIMADAPGVSLAEFKKHGGENIGKGYNHGQDVINCLYPDASVQGKYKVFGGVKDNNIYTVDLQKTGKSDGSTAFPKGNQAIKHKSDSVLIPADINHRAAKPKAATPPTPNEV